MEEAVRVADVVVSALGRRLAYLSHLVVLLGVRRDKLGKRIFEKARVGLVVQRFPFGWMV